MTIEEIFPDGEWKDENNYRIRCPYCGDHATHDHCDINVTTPQRFHCFYCGAHGTLKKLLKDQDKSGSLEPRKGVTEKKKYEPIDFNQFKKVTGKTGTLDRLALAYLTKKRGLTRAELELYNVRFAAAGRFYGRVLIPLYEDGILVNFIARSFLPFIQPKYLFPHHGETLLTTAEAIFGYGTLPAANSMGVYVIVEGVFDAIRVNRRARDLGVIGLAIMSSHLSAGQLHKLLELKNPGFFIMLDADAHVNELRVAKSLVNYDRAVRLCLLPSGDPDSLDDAGFDAAINNSQKFSFDLEMQLMLGDDVE